MLGSMSVTLKTQIPHNRVKITRRTAQNVNQTVHTKTTRETAHKFKTGGPVINNNFIRPKLL